ncbi:MAG TPA: Holliday junction resolvase RuvX [Stellaceae bacterium]|nr:Holliday junction resolvase RuvX [Stellaceae bacterium]
MAICNPADLPQILKKGQRVLGLDVGTKTIGLALSDTLLMVATPLRTVRRTRFKADAAEVLREVDAHGVGALAIGLPISLEGRESPRSQSVRQFVRNLLEVRDLPVVFWDERLSTAAVERTMIEADLTRRRRSEIIDRTAAAYILQGLLDRLAHDRGSETARST